MPRERLIIVSYPAHAPFSPRGVRTRALAAALQNEWDVELIGGPLPSGKQDRVPVRRTSALRQTLRFGHTSLLLDRVELWGRCRFHAWRPRATGALLIGYPFSPLVFAARHLSAAGVPYVVDAGDPWLLTGAHPVQRGLARRRGRKAERRLWTDAAGAVLTTEQQSSALQQLFPHLSVLVRPNGFFPTDLPPPTPLKSGHSRSTVRLAHFGELSSDRVSVAAFLRTLAESGIWDHVEFHQYGSDWTGSLIDLQQVRVVFHERRPWSDVIASAREYDAAVVVGNRDPMLLPSKAVSYLQLPIPRIALVDGATRDALTEFTADRPGWAVVAARGSVAATIVREHTAKTWTAAELAPPASESWARVADDVAQFLSAVFKDRPRVDAAA